MSELKSPEEFDLDSSNAKQEHMEHMNLTI